MLEDRPAGSGARLFMQMWDSPNPRRAVSRGIQQIADRGAKYGNALVGKYYVDATVALTPTQGGSLGDLYKLPVRQEPA